MHKETKNQPAPMGKRSPVIEGALHRATERMMDDAKDKNATVGKFGRKLIRNAIKQNMSHRPGKRK